MTLQEQYAEKRQKLAKLKEARRLARIDWDLLNRKDNLSYREWDSKFKTSRNKEEAIQYSNLSKTISSLNSEIAGLQKDILDLGMSVLEEIAKNPCNNEMK